MTNNMTQTIAAGLIGISLMLAQRLIGIFSQVENS